jgi:hypothetical protein
MKCGFLDPQRDTGESVSVWNPGKAYRSINSHTRHGVRQWLCAKFKVRGQGERRFSDIYLHQKLGLYQLSTNVAAMIRGRTCETRESN